MAMKTCESCLKRYNEVWGVCLLCGSKLVKIEEECKELCEAKGKTPEDVLTRHQIISTFSVASLVISLALGISWYFISHDRMTKEMVVRGVGGRYPVGQTYTEGTSGD